MKSLSSIFGSKKKEPVIDSSGWQADDESYLTNTGQRLKSVLNLGKGIAQGAARTVGSLGLPIMNAVIKLGGAQPLPNKIETKDSKLGRTVFGGESVSNIIEDVKRYAGKAKDLGVPDTAGLPYVIGAAIQAGRVGLDLTGFGGNKLALETALKEAKTFEEVSSLLKKAKVPDNIIRDYAPRFAKETDPKIIKEGVESLESLLKTTNEVSSYKSVEEFVEARLAKERRGAISIGQDAGVKSVFHETDPNTAFMFGRASGEKRGLNVATDLDFALGQKGKGAVVEFDADMLTGRVIKKPATSFVGKKEYEVFEGSFNPTGVKSITFVNEAAEKSLRYGGKEQLIRMGFNREVLPNGKIKYTNTRTRRSQLIDIYNQTTKKTTQQVSPDLQKEALQKELEPLSKRLGKEAEPKLKELSSLEDDIIKLKKSQVVNLDRLAISKIGKKVIETEIDLLKPKISAKVGEILTNKEVVRLSEETSNVLEGAVGREETLKWETALLNLRRRIATNAESNTVTKEFLDDLVTFKTFGTDIGRKLQSFSIKAEPSAKFTPKQAMIDAVLNVTDDVGKILDASKGVDFNDANQAAKFYRKFIAPKTSEWVDTLRYNSMLSSPLTHIKNIFSTLLNSTIRPVLEKAMVGGIDLLSSKITGKNREYFTGEAGKYALGYLKSFKEAVNRFGEVWQGIKPMTNLDVRQIPLSTEGKAAAIEQVLKIPVRLLEATDQFFQVLVEGGETAALGFRQGKGVDVFDLKQQAYDAAQYGIFRQELHAPGQGMLLDAVDVFTGVVEGLRKSQNPIVSTIAKFTVPFVRTPMNILKQGLEYTPGVGYGTMVGSQNKALQLARATIGTGIGIAAGTLLASNRMTWGEPKTTAEKNRYRDNGMQAYSVKLGDTWYSYQYLAPYLSFPLAFTALVDDAIKTKKIDDDMGTVILSAFAKYGEFLADQSYFKSIGDLMSAIGGDEFAASRLIGNYPQQLVPFRALGGWMARLTDDLQRTVDNKAGFAERQVELLMMNIPGLSQKLKPRKGPGGKPIKNENRVFNSLSSIRTQPQTPQQERRQKAYEKKKNKSKNKKFKSLSL